MHIDTNICTIMFYLINMLVNLLINVLVLCRETCEFRITAFNSRNMGTIMQSGIKIYL